MTRKGMPLVCGGAYAGAEVLQFLASGARLKRVGDPSHRMSINITMRRGDLRFSSAPVPRFGGCDQRLVLGLSFQFERGRSYQASHPWWPVCPRGPSRGLNPNAL